MTGGDALRCLDERHHLRRLRHARSFLFAVFLIVLFAGGSYVDWFPLKGQSCRLNFDELSPLGRVADYFWHLALPVAALTIGGFATLTMLTKNSFLEEISKQFWSLTRHGPRDMKAETGAVRSCLFRNDHADRRRRLPRRRWWVSSSRARS